MRAIVRSLLRSPTFTLAAVLTLSLGIGATTAIFSLVNSVLINPLRWADSRELVDISHTLEISGVARVDQSDAGHFFYRSENHSFTDVGAWRASAVNLGALDGQLAGDNQFAERVEAAYVTASVPRILGVAPLRGRSFSEGEDHPSASPVVLVSEQMWRRRFGADPSIVGRFLAVDGTSRQIVGVMPSAFAFPTDGTHLWLPAGLDSTRTESATFGWRGLARLRPGVTVETATEDLTALLKRLPEAYPGRLTVAAIDATKMRAEARRLKDVIVGDIGKTLWVILGAVALVLLIACANVANLFLVRAEARHQELAVRRALGASRSRLMGSTVSEGLLLSTLGGIFGTILAYTGLRLLQRLDSAIPLPRISEVGVDATALLAAAAITLLAALLVTLVPALRSSAAPVALSLHESSRAATAGKVRHRARNVLVISQVALALVLLAGAGLMARSFATLRAVDPGLDAERVQTFRIALSEGEFPRAQDAANSLTRIVDAVGAVPGVEATGLVSKLPFDPEARRDTAVFPEGKAFEPGEMPNLHQVAYASADYFDAAGIPLLEGRSFHPHDPSIVPLEVVLSRSVAERYWPGGQAVGRRIRLAPRGPLLSVVGVAGDIRGSGLDQPLDETVYLPLVTAPGDAVEGGAGPARYTPRELAVVVRATGSPTPLLAPLTEALRSAAPTVPLYRPREMSLVVAQSAARTSFTFTLLSIASLVALLLGAVGIYGVVSYMVSLRRREIAVRLALGAAPRRVRRMVSMQALAVAVIGVVVGLGGALALTRFLSSLLYEVDPGDPVALTLAALSLVLVALVASWIPARRAARIEPAEALRSE